MCGAVGQGVVYRRSKWSGLLALGYSLITPPREARARLRHLRVAGQEDRRDARAEPRDFRKAGVRQPGEQAAREI